MATVTVVKPKPVLVPATSVKGYRPEFIGQPGRAVPPTGFVLKTGSRSSGASTSTSLPTKAPGATLKVGANNTGPQTQMSKPRQGIKVGRADPRFVLGKGRTIIPNSGISLGNSNGAGI
jgi:hypothetical protein